MAIVTVFGQPRVQVFDLGCEQGDLLTLPFDRVLIDLLACARQVQQFQVINGLKPHLLEPALRGEHVGTIVRKDVAK